MGVAEGITRIARNIVSSVRPRSPLHGIDDLWGDDALSMEVLVGW
jgi:hypothetical protein